MPGFLSAYEGTERVDLGDGYWADVKKCLSKKEAATAQSAMGSRQRVDVGSGHQFATIDTGAYRTEMVAASIVAWNIDEADGTLWPLEPDKALRASLDRLPGPVFDRLWKVVDDLNGQESPAGRARFPGRGERGDTDGDTGAGSAAGLPDGGAVLEAAGPDEGGPGGPPAP